MQFLIAADQLLNTLLWFLPGGCWADETFSSRTWRCRHQQPFKVLRPLIDAVARLFGDIDHCRASYRSELLRSQQPPALRLDRKG